MTINKQRQYQKEWRISHPENVKKSQLKYALSHKEERKKRWLEYYYKNREALLAKVARGTIEEGVLYNYKEPLKKFEDGYGYLGTITYSKSRDKIQCHYCGKFFGQLGVHINKKHGLSGEEYKIELKLMAQTALVGEKIRENRIKWCKENANWINPTLKKFARKLKGKKPYRRSKLVGGNESLEKKNQNGTCPDQLIEKILKLKQRLNRVPSTDEFILEYNGKYLHPICLTFGSWKKALKRLNLVSVDDKNKELTNRKNLIKYLKDFYEMHRRTPETSDFKRKLLPYKGSYYNIFGTLNEARYQAGIPVKLGYFGVGGRWSFEDVMPSKVKRYGNTFVKI